MFGLSISQTCGLVSRQIYSYLHADSVPVQVETTDDDACGHPLTDTGENGKDSSASDSMVGRCVLH